MTVIVFLESTLKSGAALHWSGQLGWLDVAGTSEVWEEINLHMEHYMPSGFC